MNRPKIITIIGTRPEAIKMAPVILEFKQAADRFEHILVSTAQHREMLQQVLEAFQIKPDIDLGLMQPNQTLAGFASRALGMLANVYEKTAPDLVLVQGDTTSVMSAALAAFYQRIRVGHVEAGLRTFDRHNPFPEEINRRIVSVAADFNFAPTERSRSNLLREGVPDRSIFMTGNTVVDALRLMPVRGEFDDETLRRIPLAGRRLVTVTAHRRENHGPPLRNICVALRELTQMFDDLAIVYAVHLNPNVQRVVGEELGGCDRIHLVSPLTYPDLLRLMQTSHLMLTDSGGIQEEAPSFHKPVLILRETTERPEVVEAGAGRLVGTETARIVEEVGRLLRDPLEYKRMASVNNPFGDGYSARRIVEIIDRSLSSSSKDQVSNRGFVVPANPADLISDCEKSEKEIATRA